MHVNCSKTVNSSNSYNNYRSNISYLPDNQLAALVAAELFIYGLLLQSITMVTIFLPHSYLTYYRKRFMIWILIIVVAVVAIYGFAAINMRIAARNLVG